MRQQTNPSARGHYGRGEGEEGGEMQTFKATDTGKSAMAEVEAAIKKLPKGVFLETDEDRGVVMFWRRTPQGPGSAVQIGEIRCKQRVQL